MDTHTPKRVSPSPDRQSRFDSKLNASRKPPASTPIKFCGVNLHSTTLAVSSSPSPRRSISPKTSPRESGEISLQERQIDAPNIKIEPTEGAWLSCQMYANEADKKRMQQQLENCDSAPIQITNLADMVLLHHLLADQNRNKIFYLPALEISDSINEILKHIDSNAFAIGSLTIKSNNLSYINILEDLPVRTLIIEGSVSDRLHVGPQKQPGQLTNLSNTINSSEPWDDESISSPIRLEHIIIISDSDISIMHLKITTEVKDITIQTKGQVTLSPEQLSLHESGKIIITAEKGIKIEKDIATTEKHINVEDDSEASEEEKTELDSVSPDKKFPTVEDTTNDALIARLLQKTEDYSSSYGYSGGSIYIDNSVHVGTVNINKTGKNTSLQNMLRPCLHLGAEITSKLILAAFVLYLFPQLPFFVI